MKTLKSIIAIAAIAFSVPANAAPQKLMTGNESALHKAANDAVVGAAAVKVFCQNYLTNAQMSEMVHSLIEMGLAEPLLMAEADMRKRVGLKTTTKGDCIFSLEESAKAMDRLDQVQNDEP